MMSSEDRKAAEITHMLTASGKRLRAGATQAVADALHRYHGVGNVQDAVITALRPFVIEPGWDGSIA